MAFVYERISEEDKKNFDCKTYWIIDREREVFMEYEYFGREDDLIKFKLHSYVDGNLLIKADAKDRSIEFLRQENDKTARWYDLYNAFIPEVMMSKKEELIALFVEAIDEYGRNIANRRNDDAKIKITPFRD